MKETFSQAAGKVAIAELLKSKQQILDAFVAKFGFPLEKICMIELRDTGALYTLVVKHLDEYEYNLQAERNALEDRVKELETALQFYASGFHINSREDTTLVAKKVLE